jgi:hypothetical protein
MSTIDDPIRALLENVPDELWAVRRHTRTSWSLCHRARAPAVIAGGFHPVQVAGGVLLEPCLDHWFRQALRHLLPPAW